MSQLVTVLWVVFVMLLWVGVLATVWALLSACDDSPRDVSQVPTND